MNGLLKLFLSLSFSGLLLILLLFFCKPLFKNKFSKQWQYYIWLIVIARLLLPFSLKTNFVENVFQKIDNITSQTDTILKFKQNIPISEKISIPENSTSTDKETVTETNIQSKPFTQLVRNIFTILTKNIGTLWIIIAIVLLIRKITIYQSFVNYIKAGQTEVFDIELLERFGELVEQAGIKKAVALYANNLISSPLLIGFFRPCIVLPSTQLSDSDFQYTILHELTHYKHKDMFYKWLVQITICLHWFNPFVYLMSYEINRCCELSCDETVIKKLDDKGKEAYGDTLLNAIKIKGNYKNSLASITLNEGKKLLKERLDAIILVKKKTFLSITTCIMFTIILCFGASITGAYTFIPNVDKIDKTEKSNIPNIKDMTVLEFKDIPRLGISVLTENIVVNQGGNTLKIMFNEKYKDDYIVDNYIHSTSKLREVCIERKDLDNPQKNILQTIYITVPENTTLQLSSIETTTGNISISNINAGKLYLYSTSGSITYLNNMVSDLLALKSETGTIFANLPDKSDNYKIDVNTDSSSTIKIDGKSYQGGEFELNTQSKKTIQLYDSADTITINSANFSSDNLINVSSSSDNNSIEIKKSKIDVNNTIRNLEINAEVVNLDFQVSTNNTFEATLSYPQELAALYAGARLSMKNTSQTIKVGINYPDGEINQNSNIDPETAGIANLLIKVPSKQYNLVTINIAASTKVKFNIDAAFAAITNYAGNTLFSFVNKCDNITITNKVGNFTLIMDSVNKKLTINNIIGKFCYIVSHEPKNFHLQLTGIGISDFLDDSYTFELPTYWKYKINNKNTLTYKNGNGSNIAKVFNDDVGQFIMKVNK